MLEALYNAIRKDAKPVVIDVKGKKYSTSDLKPVHEPRPEAITVKNLSSLVDFLNRNVDELPLDKLICHVESPNTVSIKSALVGDHEDLHHRQARPARTSGERMDPVRKILHRHAGLLHG